MNNHPIDELMSTTMQKIREMVDVNTIVGTPINTADGITLIPISKATFGCASGGSDFGAKNLTAANQQLMFGGGSGAAVNIVPVAFVVISGGSVRILPVTPPANTAVDRVIELVPEMVEKITEMIPKKDKKGNEEEKTSASQPE